MEIKDKLLLLLGLVTVVILSTVLPVMAVDTSNAQYLTTVSVSNNGTAVTNESVVFTCNTSAMIDADMLDAAAIEATMQFSGNDVAFMPGYGSNPWVTYVSSLGAYSTSYRSLYTGNQTTGDISIFLTDAGMSVNDDADLEIDVDGSVFYDAFITVDDVGMLWEKESSICLATDGTGVTANTSAISALTVRPTDNSTVALSVTGASANYQAVDEEVADDDTTYVYQPTADALWDYDYYTIDTSGFEGDYQTNFTLTVYNRAKWASAHGATSDVYTTAMLSATPGYGTIHDLTGSYVNYSDVISRPGGGTWTAADFDNLTIGTGLRSSVVNNVRCTQVWAVIDYTAVGTVNGTTTSAQHQIIVTSDTDTLYLYIDGSLEDSNDLITPDDNGNDWYFGNSSATLYIASANITTGGTLYGHWEWEYAATFTDLSGNGNTATPSLRTTSTDSDLSAAIVTQAGLITADSPASASGEGWTMIGAIPDEPSGMFDEGGDSYGIGDLDIGALVTGAAESAGQDATSWHIILVFALSIAAGITIYKLTNRYKLGQRGSLVIAVVASEVVLIVFYIFGTLPGLALIPYGLIGLLLIVWRKSAAPVD